MVGLCSCIHRGGPKTLRPFIPSTLIASMGLEFLYIPSTVPLRPLHPESPTLSCKPRPPQAPEPLRKLKSLQGCLSRRPTSSRNCDVRSRCRSFNRGIDGLQGVEGPLHQQMRPHGLLKKASCWSASEFGGGGTHHVISSVVGLLEMCSPRALGYEGRGCANCRKGYAMGDSSVLSCPWAQLKRTSGAKRCLRLLGGCGAHARFFLFLLLWQSAGI